MTTPVDRHRKDQYETKVPKPEPQPAKLSTKKAAAQASNLPKTSQTAKPHADKFKGKAVPLKSESPMKPTSRKVSSVKDKPFPKASTPSAPSKTGERIKEGKILDKSATALMEFSAIQPLKPISQGETASDVYMTKFENAEIQDVIFKPGMHGVVKNIIAYELARAVGITHAVLPAKIGKASVIPVGDYHVYTRYKVGTEILVDHSIAEEDRIKPIVGFEDKDGKILGKVGNQNYEFILNENGRYQAVETEFMMPVGLGLKPSLTLSPDIDPGFSLDLEQASESDEEVDEGEAPELEEEIVPEMLDPEDEFIIAYKDGKPFLIQCGEDEKSDKEILDLVTDKNNKKSITLNNNRYNLEISPSGSVRVIGKNVEGLVQMKVNNTYTTPSSASGRSSPLNILNPSENREHFYKRIDMPSYIECFLATMLIRPSDGKITDLEDSNVLFEALPNDSQVCDPMNPSCRLRPVMIDLDESLPSKNGLVEKEGVDGVHAMRNGLMAFPQAWGLSDDERNLVVAGIKKMIEKKAEIRNLLFKFVNDKSGPEAFNIENIKACIEVIDRMEAFLEKPPKDWKLKDLFFYVFPEYFLHWKKLGDLSPEDKAMHIGKHSEDEFEDILNR